MLLGRAHPKVPPGGGQVDPTGAGDALDSQSLPGLCALHPVILPPVLQGHAETPGSREASAEQSPPGARGWIPVQNAEELKSQLGACYDFPDLLIVGRAAKLRLILAERVLFATDLQQ